jgi:hypothetical protein
VKPRPRTKTRLAIVLAVATIAAASIATMAAWLGPKVAWYSSGALIDLRTSRPDLDWHDAAAWTIEGRGWKDVASPYHRLPARARDVVPPSVWGTSQHSAGLSVRFVADTREIAVRWTLLVPWLDLPTMPATGKSGLDLYGRGADGKWQRIGSAAPDGRKNFAVLATELPAGKQEYRLYLPLCNGVTRLEIGLTPGAIVEPPSADDWKRKPIVVYGTSIVQGEAASRPGQAWTSLLGRRLDRPIVNLGFSGSAKLEPVPARLMAELDAEAFIIDPLPNCSAAEVAERLEPFVAELRRARPQTPIVLVEYPTRVGLEWKPSLREEYVARRTAYRAAYEGLQAQGVKHLIYVAGDDLVHEEERVDDSHPSDRGHARTADVLGPILEAALSNSSF